MHVPAVASGTTIGGRIHRLQLFFAHIAQQGEGEYMDNAHSSPTRLTVENGGPQKFSKEKSQYFLFFWK